MKKKVLLIRLDKIGDLICSLPADQVLDESAYDVTWAVQKGLGQVVELGEKKRRYIELDKNNEKEASLKLKNFLNENNFDYAVSFQCPWWVNFELFKAGVPHRAGVKSQWHSFLFLNEALRQKRSQAEKHELEYNLDIIYKAFRIQPTKDSIYFHITKPLSFEVLEKFNLAKNNYIVVHPGMMGSALNWSQSQYIEYIQKLVKQNKKIVITGTDADEIYLTEIKKEFENHPQVTWLQSKLNMKELVQILAYSEFVVAPSTGVAHLAAGVGASIKGIYSPVRVHHPKRWAPRGPNVEIWMIENVR
ncbi:MAG: glycosyltransferase family 9 protein [Pseudobdellovibrio sp.]